VDEWQGEYLKAFEKLKDAVAGATELNLPGVNAEWVLRVDASGLWRHVTTTHSGVGQSRWCGDGEKLSRRQNIAAASQQIAYIRGYAKRGNDLDAAKQQREFNSGYRCI